MSLYRERFRVMRCGFAFWVGLGLFNLAESLHAERLDDLAALAMRATEPTTPDDTAASTASKPEDALKPEHWTAAENNTWRWFEREHRIDGRWKLTGITTPIHKRTGQLFQDAEGYLDNALVPESLRGNEEAGHKISVDDVAVEDDAGRPNVSRRARHGRPPSRWLRRLYAKELRTWLKTIDVPEAGVSGMTYWEHLTRDHSFDAVRIAGLSETDQARLHAAAHYGY